VCFDALVPIFFGALPPSDVSLAHTKSLPLHAMTISLLSPISANQELMVFSFGLSFVSTLDIGGNA